MTLDGEKEIRQDALPEKGRPSPEAKSNPSRGASPKSYTESEVTKMLNERHSKMDKTIAQLTGERDTLKTDLQATTSRLDALEREANESRLAEARNDPDQLRAYQRDQSTTKREREVEARDADTTRREGQLGEKEKDLTSREGKVSVAIIAAEHGLEMEDLLSLGISDHDTLERVAEKLATAKPKEPGGEGEEGEAFVPDSGETAGSGEPTMEQLEKMPMGQYAAHVQKRDEKSRQ